MSLRNFGEPAPRNFTRERIMEAGTPEYELWSRISPELQAELEQMEHRNRDAAWRLRHIRVG